MKTKKWTSIIIIFTLIIGSMTPTYAWKLNTHVYSGNLILEDLADGYLEIDNVGTFKVPDDIYDAITKYPDSYRAGTLGPDIFPEMATGQGNIHPELIPGQIDSGKYLDLMIDAYNRYPNNDPEKQKIYAFILGYSTHYAGDLFGHSFVNDWADGVFPSIDEIKSDVSKSNIALRHIVAESYVDLQIPDEQKTGANIALDAPISFIKEVLLDEASEKYQVSPYLQNIQSLKSSLNTQVESLKAYQGGDLSISKIASYGVNTNIAGYSDRWLQDIDNGLLSWVSANQDMAKALIDKDKSSEDALEPINNWVEENGLIMAGSPDTISKILGISIDTFLQMLNLITTEEIREYIKQAKHDAVLWAIEETFGVNIDEMLAAMKNPIHFLNSPLFDTDTKSSEILDIQLKNFGQTSVASEIEFEPFYNTVQMGKLVLLGADNLNTIFQNTNFNQRSMTDSFNKIDVKIHTGKNSSNVFDNIAIKDNATKGSDDDIFFVVTLKDGSIHKKLMDKPGYNDFESNDTDTYTLELTKSITYSEIQSVRVEKNTIINDDWWPEWIEITARNGNKIYESGAGKSDYTFDKVFKGNASWSATPNLDDPIVGSSSFDPKIINFIHSLDASKQWIYSDIYNNDPEIFSTIFKDVDKVFVPSETQIQ